MIESRLRPTYQRWLIDPLLKQPLLKQIPPLLVTLLAGSLGILSALCIATGFSIWALFLLTLSGFLDTLDGSLARAQQCSSPKGAVLDILCDRIVEFALLLGLFFVDPSSRALLTLCMLGSV